MSIGVGHAVHSALARGWPLVTDQADTARALSPLIDTDELP
ncbi:hypothetical protein [Amycolatopsis cihanbeyliensis]|uniref:Uncharacterized protein n=1 Tax=Amycolatopsis cihanbeyliensis TaxID=1128664 RepID=A0A542DLI0_AMYCI|nr:hypothetical protein [Amycolatopsis cihanbeyliensis]TQJ03933.1 hypothetical protein FB471_3708 [Amycolatopsis cihanbeyliensis]